MALTYKIRGADGKEYGPATLLQVTTWLREGRINEQTEMTRSDISYWASAGKFPEIVPPSAPAIDTAAAGAPAQPATASDDPALDAQMKSGGSWFYWIAGLSLINSIVAVSGGDWGFIVGLGITQLFDAFGQSFPGAGKAIVLLLDLVVVGVFVLFGVFANKRHSWAFVVGMILYTLDGLLLLLFQDWLGLGFHAFVLFCLFRGFTACRQLNAS